MSLIASAGCVPATPPQEYQEDVQEQQAARIRQMKNILFAYETDAMCSLEVAQRGADNAFTNWQSFAHNEVVGVPFSVSQISETGDVLTIQATTEAEPGKVFAFRNKYAPGTPVAQAMNCIVDADKIRNRNYTPKFKYVRLDGQKCARISPIMGSSEDLTLSPYTIVGRGVFVGQAAGVGAAYRQSSATTGHLLEAMGGRKRLWLTSHDLHSCFSNFDRPPPPPEQAEALLAWLRSPEPDAVDPPEVNYDTVTALTGLTRERCMEEDFSNGKPGLACNAPVIRIITDDVANPFKQRGLNFVQDRSVAGLYFQENKLVSPLRAVNKEVAVEVSGGFTRLNTAVKEALRPSIEDETKRRQRASSGRYALLSSTDRRKATHTIELVVERNIPEVEITEEPRRHKYIAGRKQVPNPAYRDAEQAILAAAERVDTVSREGELATERAATANALCSGAGADLAAAGAGMAAEKATSNIPFAGGLLAGAAKKAVKDSVTAGCEAGIVEATRAKVLQRAQEATDSLMAAKTAFDNTPKFIEVPDERIHEYVAKTYRRRGAAQATVVVRDKRNRKLYEEKISVPFETEQLEIPEIPEVQLKGQKASPPSVSDLEDALGLALVPLIEGSIVRFSAEALVGESVGDAKRGTRSWSALVASEAAANRPVTLLMDILENRNVASGSVRIPVSFPNDSADKCFIFAGTDSAGEANVDLVLRGDGDFPIAQDRRMLIDAAFELCGRKAEKYELEIISPPDSTRAILVSLFESTPGKFKAEDVAKAAKGSPHVPLANDAFVLDASGEIRAKSTGGTVVVGRLGDRDGDGVDDSADRCPYEVETANYFLDDDGCPDEAPAGYVPDPELVKTIDAKRAAAVAAGTATHAQLATEAQRKAELEAKQRAKEEAQRLADEQAQKKEEAKKQELEEAEKQRKAAAALIAAEKARAELETAKAREALKAAEEERKRAEEEHKKALEDRAKAEEERRAAEDERKKADKDKAADKEKDSESKPGDSDKNEPPKKKPTEIYIP